MQGVSDYVLQCAAVLLCGSQSLVEDCTLGGLGAWAHIIVVANLRREMRALMTPVHPATCSKASGDVIKHSSVSISFLH